jgi:hypothetical protein
MFARALSLIRPPTTRNSRTNSRRMSKRASSLNRPPNRTRMNRLGSAVNSVRRRAGSVASGMRSVRRRAGSALGSIIPAMNKRGLLPYGRSRHRKREYNKLEHHLKSEIESIIKRNTENTDNLKKELIDLLDDRIDFNHNYSYCYPSEEKYKIASLFEYIIYKMYAYHDSDYKHLTPILEKVKNVADDRKFRCQPLDTNNY